MSAVVAAGGTVSDGGVEGAAAALASGALFAWMNRRKCNRAAVIAEAGEQRHARIHNDFCRAVVLLIRGRRNVLLSKVKVVELGAINGSRVNSICTFPGSVAIRGLTGEVKLITRAGGLLSPICAVK